VSAIAIRERWIKLAEGNGNTGKVVITVALIAFIALLFSVGTSILNVGITFGEKNQREKDMIERLQTLEGRQERDELLILSSDADKKQRVEDLKQQRKREGKP
jgi:hypothetical protein